MKHLRSSSPQIPLEDKKIISVVNLSFQGKSCYHALKFHSFPKAFGGDSVATEGFKRKLTAILSADVAGYSRLMGEDESATVRTLEAYRRVIVDLIQQHRGRVVDSPGDNILAEFASVVDAVQCAVAVQKEIQTRNLELPETRIMQFRIGINLGDVIEEGDRLYGDGVNIAARLESLAEPGGICVSKTAFDHIETKLPLGYEYLGEQSVKNIAKPVGAYRVQMDPRVTVKARDEGKPKEGARRSPAIIALVVVLLVAVGAVALWRFAFSPAGPAAEKASKPQMALPLPDKPSIAVLPFNNLSGDPAQEYFSDGITEEIITALSKVPKFFVVARNSTFTYKAKPVKVQQVGQELGVRYVLEGSVQKAGDRIRINAQLIDARTGNHLWAERYDRNLQDLFAVQDELTKKIITAMQVKLTEGEQVRAAARRTNNLEAYLKYLQARDLLNRGNTQSIALAEQLAEEAITLDPRYSSAYYILGRTALSHYWAKTGKSPQDSLEKSIELLQKAITLDNTNAEAHSVLGWIFSIRGQHDKAVAEGEKAVALDPNSAEAHMYFGKILTFADRDKESIAELQTAIRLNPIPPTIYLYSLGISYILTGQYDEAIAWCEKAVRQEPNSWTARLFLTAAYSLAGRDEKARIEAAEVLRINPKFSLENFAQSVTYKDKADKELLFGALRKAGLK
jgi:adenylate cyclase